MLIAITYLYYPISLYKTIGDELTHPRLTCMYRYRLYFRFAEINHATTACCNTLIVFA